MEKYKILEKTTEVKLELTDEDFKLADEILDTVMKDPRRALKLYMSAKAQVKKMLGNIDPRELLIAADPNIDDQKVIEFMNTFRSNDELGMRRIYATCNNETRQAIDELIS